MLYVLLLCGLAGCGKDTFANFLLERFPHCRKFNFADSMKEQTVAFFHNIVPLSFFYDRDKKDAMLPKEIREKIQAIVPECNTPRDLLIFYAAKQRSQDPDYFTKSVARSIGDHVGRRSSLHTSTTPFEISCVVADCRFENEVNFIRNECKQYTNVIVEAIWIERPSLELNVTDNTQISKSFCKGVVQNNHTPFQGSDMLHQLRDLLVHHYHHHSETQHSSV